MSGKGKPNIPLLWLYSLNGKLSCDECDSITWFDPNRGSRIDVPSNIVAIAVDRINHRGAIRVYDQGKYVGGVGSETAEDVIVIPWELNWSFIKGGI